MLDFLLAYTIVAACLGCTAILLGQYRPNGFRLWRWDVRLHQEFRLADCWIGAHWRTGDEDGFRLWLCLYPCLPIYVSLQPAINRVSLDPHRPYQWSLPCCYSDCGKVVILHSVEAMDRKKGTLVCSHCHRALYWELVPGFADTERMLLMRTDT